MSQRRKSPAIATICVWSSVLGFVAQNRQVIQGIADDREPTADCMVALLTLELRIEHAQSLKDKRQVVRSLKDRLRAHFNVATAELDSSGLWNRASIGVVSVSDSRDYLDGLMKNVEREALRIANNAGADVADSFLEFL